MRGIGFYFSARMRYALICVLLLTGFVSLRVRAQSGQNPVLLENQNPGVLHGWELYRNGNDLNDLKISGFSDKTSYNKGDTIHFRVSVSETTPYTIDVFRIGWYNGLGSRLMHSSGTLNGAPQTACPLNAQNGLIECAWSNSHSITVPQSWTSGVYVALLSRPDKWQSHITFVVRDDARRADILYHWGVLNAEAYNFYPNDGVTGKSLYNSDSYGSVVPATQGKRAAVVSLDRPNTVSFVTGSQIHISDYIDEIHMIMWLEKNGYNVAYATDVDLHTATLTKLQNYKVLMFGSHAEYWTSQMYTNAELARDNGINLFFPGGNEVYWQVRLEPNAAGVPNRRIVCYKSIALDPEPTLLNKTATFRDIGRPEQKLMGTMFTGDNYPTSNTSLIATNTAHWAFAGSNAANGATLPNLNGREINRLMPQYTAPISLNFTILMSSPFTSLFAIDTSINTVQNTTIYQAPSGAYVFSAGAISWNWSLGRVKPGGPNYTNAIAERITRNVLDRMIFGLTPPTPTFTPTATLTPAPSTATPTRTPAPITSTPTIAPVTSTVQPPASNRTYLPVISGNPNTAAQQVHQGGPRFDAHDEVQP
jgi:hypothetical protein